MAKKPAKKRVTSSAPKKEHRFRTPIWKQRFLEELARTGVVKLACLKAPISRVNAYKARQKDSAFADEWDDAIDEATDIMVAVARQRAMNGTERPVFNKGKQCGKIQEYSDTLLIFLLKAYRPEMFRDSYDLAKALDGITKRTSS
jgi:hypothetical protein